MLDPDMSARMERLVRIRVGRLNRTIGGMSAYRENQALRWSRFSCDEDQPVFLAGPVFVDGGPAQAWFCLKKPVSLPTEKRIFGGIYIARARSERDREYFDRERYERAFIAVGSFYILVSRDTLIRLRLN